MSTEQAARRRRVQAVVAAGRRIANPDDPLGASARARLPAATGLSPAGVELALSRHLETPPEDDQLASLLAACGTAPTCHVVLSANVCTAPLRALACAVATAPVVTLRPSRRDPVLAELLVEALGQSSGFEGRVRLVSTLAAAPGDEVHLYGSDETLAAILPTLPAGTQVRAHGTGLGIALLEEGTDLVEGAARLADDVVVFDGKGCLTPRFALVVGDEARAERFAARLAETLDHRARQVPRQALHADEQAALTRYRNLIDSLGQCWVGEHHAVGLDPDPTQLVLPPAIRCVHVVPVGETTLAPLLAPWTALVTAIGRSAEGPLGRRALALCPVARVTPLGQMQQPPLDGPVDLRTIVATAPSPEAC
ncbi:MAG: proline dehydrogenase [Deltaproteobacteria bacterium]|nr:proline dehydrogenase [Deltaproteobacteria bacterium]